MCFSYRLLTVYIGIQRKNNIVTFEEAINLRNKKLEKAGNLCYNYEDKGINDASCFNRGGYSDCKLNPFKGCR